MIFNSILEKVKKFENFFLEREKEKIIDKLIKKQGFDPVRRAVTGAIAAFSLPIKIPKLADVNADFKKMILSNAFSGLALPVESDEAFNKAFVEKHGSYWPDAMGDLEYRAEKVTGGVLSLVENTYQSLVATKDGSLLKDHGKAVDFHDAFNDKIYEALRNLYKQSEYSKGAFGRHYANNAKDFAEYVNEMLNVDRGQLGTEWQSGHNALYINDPVEYSALVSEAYKIGRAHV